MKYFPGINMEKTGANIEALRKTSGISVKELQEIFGFETPQAIYKWQRGTALPTVDHLVVLSAVFKVKMEDILILSPPAPNAAPGPCSARAS